MIGMYLRTMRRVNNLTQEELSRIVKIPQNTISQYETGRIEPSFDIIEAIAKACGFEVNFVGKKETLNSKNIKRKEL